MANKLLIVFCVAGCSTATSGDRTTLDNIPRPAAAALEARAGTAPIAQVARGKEKGVEVYEATWFDNELEREAKVTADGKLVELEEQVLVEDVPPVVIEAAMRKLPAGATYKYIRLMGDRWEVEARIGGQEHDVVLSETGEILGGEVEDDDDDDEDDGDSDD